MDHGKGKILVIHIDLDGPRNVQQTSKPVGDHLTDDQFLRMVLDDIKDESEQEPIARHVNSCITCMTKLAQLLHLYHVWDSSDEQTRLLLFSLHQRLTDRKS